MSGRNHPGGWGCVKGGWSPVAVGWSNDQGCSGSWDGATGDAPAEQRPEQERTPHAEKASVLLPIPGSTMSWGRGSGPE